MLQDVIDFHRNYGPGLDPAATFGPLRSYESFDELLGDSAGGVISRYVLYAPSWSGDAFVDPDYSRSNAVIEGVIREHGEQVTGFLRVNPKFGASAVEQVENALGNGFSGLKLDCEAEAFSPLDMGLLGPLLEICGQRGWPVLVRTGFHPAQPFLWLRAAKAFPNVNFVLGHMGYRVAADAFILAKNAGNVYLETSGQQPSNLRRALNAVSHDRIIFGTDAPYTDPQNEIDRLLALKPSDDVIQAICIENARRLLPSTW